MDEWMPTGSVVEFTVLGPLRASTDGRIVDVGGVRQRRLLSVLLAAVGTVVSTHSLIDRVWDDADRPENADRALRTYVSRLRRSLREAGLDADRIVTTQPPGYSLAVPAEWTDSHRFSQLVDAARDKLANGNSLGALVDLDEALSLWAGRAYDEFADLSWAEAEAGRLAELKRVALEERAAVRLDLGAHAEVIGDLESLITDEPLRTRPVELLMLGLYRSGRQAEALRAASMLRRTLTEIGLDVPPHIASLENRIATGDAQLAPVNASNETIRGYRLMELLGEGAFSSVYRSVQPSLGREVAVKQMHSTLADRPEFIRRFEAEAQLVARLEHPHIVPLYDYWREPGSAFLVMRWLRGGSLATLLSDRRLSLAESGALAAHVGSALGESHRSGVVHRDVRSANVFLDEIGNFYLGDYGIATDASHANTDDGDMHSDIRGFGTLLLEALCGATPRPDKSDLLSWVSTTRPDISPSTLAPLMRSTMAGPDERYESVEEFVADYLAALAATGLHTDSETRSAQHPSVANPFKGLRAFVEADATDFYGRELLVDQMVGRLDGGEGTRILTVLGPSGSGKSSLVRAGLLPALRAGAVHGSENWFITTMMPGAHPFEELESALTHVALHPVAGLSESTREDLSAIGRMVRSALDAESAVLLVIDQFEELFTLVDDEIERRQFIDGLLEATADPRVNFRVVVTIRADHWHRPLQYAALGRYIETAVVTVTPMSAEELDRAIIGPATAAGVGYETGLVPTIIADVFEQPGALPLLQFLLARLYDERDAASITTAAYERLGGVAGALAATAEEVFQACDEYQRSATKRLFTRLITPGLGVSDTRRRVRLSELETVPSEVIRRFDDVRMLAFDHDPSTREPTVEVAHEALIGAWPRLGRWIDDDRDGLHIVRHLTAASTDWRRSSRQSDELYRGGRLETAEGWYRNHPEELTAAESEFVECSIARREEELDDEHRRMRRLRVLLVATATTAVIAVVAGLIAWTQQRQADDNARSAAAERATAVEAADREREARLDATEASAVAESAQAEAEQSARDADTARVDGLIQQRIAESARLRDENPTLSMLIAREVFDRAPSNATLGAVLTSLQRTDDYLGHIPIPHGWNNDQWLGLLDDDTAVVRTLSTIEVFDLETRQRVSRTDSDARIHGWYASGSTGGGRFVTTTADGQVTTIEAGATTPTEFPIEDDTFATVAGVAADQSLIIGFENGLVEVVRSNGDRVALDGHTFVMTAVALNADASHAATMDGVGNITMWDVTQQRPMWTITRFDHERWLQPPKDVATVLQFGLVEGGPPQTPPDAFDVGAPFVNLRDLRSGMEFKQDGTLLFLNNALFSAHDVNTGLAVWAFSTDASTPQLHELSGGSVAVGNEFYLEGTRSRRLDGLSPTARVAVTSDDSTAVALDGRGLSLWSLDGDQLIARAHERSATGVAEIPTLSRGGEFLAAYEAAPGGFGANGRLEGADGVARGLDAPENSWILFNSAGDLVVYSPETPEVQFIDPASGSAVAPPIPVGSWASIETSRDGRLVAVGLHITGDPTVTIYDASTGAVLTTLVVPFDSTVGVNWSDFSPDGSHFAASNGQGVTIWSTADWSLVDKRAAEPDSSFNNVAFSPDSTTLAFSTDTSEIWTYDLDTATLGKLATNTVIIGSVFSVNALEFSDDGSYIVASGGGFSIVDARTGEPVGDHFPDGDAGIVSSIAAGGRAAVTGTDTHLLVWDLQPDRWPEVACHAAGRNMTEKEWEQWGFPDEPYHATCDRWESAIS